MASTRLVLVLALLGTSTAFAPRLAMPSRSRAVLRSSPATDEPAVMDEPPSEVTAELLSTFVRELYEQPPTEQRGGVDFLQYDDRFVNPPFEGEPPADRPVMLYVPGLEFSGVSGCGAFPTLASRFELWRCRVPSEDRSTFDDLATVVVEFVQDQLATGKNVTLIGESFGGLLVTGVAQQLTKAGVGSASASQPGLAGLVLVNPATSFDRTPWDRIGPAVASVPADKFEVPVLSQLAESSSVPPQASLYGLAGGAVLGATVTDGETLVRGLQGVANDLLDREPFGTFTPPSPADLPPPTPDTARRVVSKLAQRATTAVGLIDVLTTRLSPDVLNWRLKQWLGAGCTAVNSELTELRKAGVPVLAVAGDQDRLLPSVDEARRLESVLGSRICKHVVLEGIGHAAMDDRVDLLKLMDSSPIGLLNGMGDFKAPVAKDYVNDFVRPNATVVAQGKRGLANLERAVSPVFISTDESGNRAFGLGKVPLPKTSGRPVLLVGNHQLYALDLGLLISEFLTELDVLPRGLAHPVTFGGGPESRFRDRYLTPENRLTGVTTKGTQRSRSSRRGGRQGTNAGEGGGEGGAGMGAFGGIGSFTEFGAVPVTPRNFYKLMKNKEMALLFPGGVRESNHGKGEEYKLFWPKRTDFVRMAAASDAIIVPFGATGAADTVSLLLDTKELEALPVIGDLVRQSAERVPAARRGMWEAAEDEQENFAFPIGVPNPRGPDRFYFCFGKPFDTRDIDPKDKGACDAAYASIQAEVEASIDFTLQGRKRDPFRLLPPRLAYEQLFGKRAPSFSLGAVRTRRPSNPALNTTAPGLSLGQEQIVKMTSRQV